MNKIIINIFTYLVIFLAITQIINYLYNNIYGSLIFFLLLSIGLYFITKKNVPISLLLAIVITNILNVSDVLDNNLYEGRRDLNRKQQRERIARQNASAIRINNANTAEIADIKQQLDSKYEERRSLTMSHNSLYNDHGTAEEKVSVYTKELNDKEVELTNSEKTLGNLNEEIIALQNRLSGYPGALKHPDPNPPVTVTDVLGISERQNMEAPENYVKEPLGLPN